MKNILTKTQAEILKQTSTPAKLHQVGEIYPEIFDVDFNLDFQVNMPLNVAIIWLGAYELDSNLFQREKCPICGKEEVLIPYFCGASILSGSHIIKFYCTSCFEQIVFNNKTEYYHKIRDYILKNKNSLKPSKLIKTYSQIE